MSDFGKDVIDVEEIKEAAMKKAEETQGFFEKHGAKIALGVSIVASFLLNKKINKLQGNTAKAFRKVENFCNDHVDWCDKNFKDCFDNFKFIQADISNLATTIGYQGKLGVNKIMED